MIENTTYTSNSSSNLPAVESFGRTSPIEALLETSRAKKIVGPLVLKAHQKNAQKIAVLSWDLEQTNYNATRILALALSHELDRKCALVVSEGIRVHKSEMGLFDQVSLPEVEVPAFQERIDTVILEMNKTYPIQLIVGPAIKDWEMASPVKRKIVTSAHAHILLIPESGLARGALKGIEAFQKEHKLTWLGMIQIQKGGLIS